MSDRSRPAGGWHRLAIALLALLLTSTAGAQPLAGQLDQFPLEDDIQILVFPQRILAIAGQNRELVQDLEIGEKIVWQGVRGRVGIVLTDRRILAVSADSGFWQSKRYRRTEQIPDPPLMGGRVALILTRTRAIGFDGGSGNLVERSIGPNEKVLDWAVGQNVGVIITDRRAMGVTPFRGGFFEVKISAGEKYQGVATVANTATVTTSRRLLIFRSQTGVWERKTLDLRDRR